MPDPSKLEDPKMEQGRRHWREWLEGIPRDPEQTTHRSDINEMTFWAFIHVTVDAARLLDELEDR